jgi:hypothetical protein
VTTLIAQIVRFARPNIRIYDAPVIDLYRWAYAQYLAGAKGAETMANAVNLGSRPNFGMDHAGATGRCLLLTRKELHVIGARALPEPPRKQRVGGGGGSHMRTGLGYEFPDTREFTGKIRELEVVRRRVEANTSEHSGA